jgi:hypothetical protein
MGAGIPRVVTEEASEHIAKRREEVDLMLDAIVGAIAAGRLPPDDAAAWAKIAAYEVEMFAPELNVSCPS